MSTGGRSRGRPRHPDLLTPAEWRIAHAVRHGMSTRVIAERQGVSTDAVKYHIANILQKLQLDTRAQLRIWTGVPVDGALHRDRTTRETTMNLNLGRIGQISRQVNDIEHSVSWYRDVLGLPHLYTFGELAFFDCGGTRLFLSALDEPLRQEGESVIYFQVDDIEAAHRELAARGVTFTSAPHLIHRHESGVEEWMAFFDDPDGHTLALMAQTSNSEDVG